MKEPQQASVDENVKRWSCIDKFGNELVPWTHAAPLPPPEPPPLFEITFEQCVGSALCEQSLWDSLVNEFILSHDPSQIVHTQQQVKALFGTPHKTTALSSS